MGLPGSHWALRSLAGLADEHSLPCWSSLLAAGWVCWVLLGGVFPFKGEDVGYDQDFRREFERGGAVRTGAGISQLDVEGGKAFRGLRNLGYVHSFFLFAQFGGGVGFADDVQAEVAGGGIGGLPQADFGGLVLAGYHDGGGSPFSGGA